MDTARPNKFKGEPDEAKVSCPVWREGWWKQQGEILELRPVPTLRDPTPSPEDAALTREIRKAGDILDIELLDHIVIGAAGKFVSLKERGLGFDKN